MHVLISLRLCTYGCVHVCVARTSVDPYAETDYRKGNSQLRQNPLLVKIETGKVCERMR
jgi:hypothetical protein